MAVQKQSCITKHIEECLEDYRHRKYSAKSIKSFQNGFNRFVEYLASVKVERLQDVNLSHLEAFQRHLVELGLSARTVDQYMRSVKGLFGYLADNDHIFLNPAARLRLPHFPRKLGAVPTEEEMKRLLNQPDPAKPLGIRDRAVLEMFYSCGMRREELAELTIFDPDVKQATIRVMGKGRKERVLPLGKQALFWLKKYLENVRPQLSKDLNEHGLWLSGQGQKIGAERIFQFIKRYGKAAGIKTPLSAHALRRACATHMLNNGAHPVQIQMLLGHSSLDTLSQYLQVTVTDMRKMHEGSRPGR